MIATLRGEVIQIEDNSLIIEVGGVGMRVFVPKPLLTKFNTGEMANHPPTAGKLGKAA